MEIFATVVIALLPQGSKFPCADNLVIESTSGRKSAPMIGFSISAITKIHLKVVRRFKSRTINSFSPYVCIAVLLAANSVALVGGNDFVLPAKVLCRTDISAPVSIR